MPDQPPVTFDTAQLNRLTLEEEVELTMAVTGENEVTAEFMVAIRRGHVDGDIEVLA